MWTWKSLHFINAHSFQDISYCWGWLKQYHPYNLWITRQCENTNLQDRSREILFKNWEIKLLEFLMLQVYLYQVIFLSVQLYRTYGSLEGTNEKVWPETENYIFKPVFIFKSGTIPFRQFLKHFRPTASSRITVETCGHQLSISGQASAWPEVSAAYWEVTVLYWSFRWNHSMISTRLQENKTALLMTQTKCLHVPVIFLISQFSKVQYTHMPCLYHRAGWRAMHTHLVYIPRLIRGRDMASRSTWQ